MADERLFQFPTKPTPVPADIVYLGDSAAGFNEVQSTIEEIIGAYPGLLSIGDQSVIANQILYTSGVDTWVPAPITAFGRSLIEQVDNLTTQTLLALVPGTNIQAFSAALLSIAGLTTAADKMIYTTASNTYATSTLSAVARTMLAQTTNATILSTIGALPLAGGTMSGLLVLSGDPTADLGASTKQYVDNAVAGAVSQFVVRLASTANFTYTYANGTLGVGATLTASAPGAVTMDSVTVLLNDFVLFKNQSTTFQNGIYKCTNDGSVTAAVFTRAVYYDTPAEIQPGDLVTVNAGTTNAQTSWRETATVTAVGTDPITFSQYTVNPANFLQVANNLSDVANAATARTNLGLGSVATKTASNAALTNAVMQSGASVINNIPKYNDITGTLVDSGFAISAVVKTVKTQTFTASGTYTPSTGMLYAWVRIVGGGGSGGGSPGATSQICVGSGGGSGTYTEVVLSAASVGASQVVTIGAGGASGGAANGNPGGTSSVGSTTAPGGGGGIAGVASATLSRATGAAGGVAGAGGDITIPGGAGGCGFSFTTAAGFCGAGGSSVYGAGGQSFTIAAGVQNGVAGSAYGAGGGGSVSVGLTNGQGGAAANGLVIIHEFCSQ